MPNIYGFKINFKFFDRAKHYMNDLGMQYINTNILKLKQVVRLVLYILSLSELETASRFFSSHLDFKYMSTLYKEGPLTNTFI